MADTIEGAIRTYVLSSTTVSAYISSRLYWHRAPEVPTIPYVIFFGVDDPHQPMYFDEDEMRTKAGQRRMQFTVVDDESLRSLGIQNEIMDRLRWASGSINGFTVETIKVADMRQRIDPDTLHYLNDIDVIVEYFEA